MGCIAGTEIARNQGITKETHQKHSCSWGCWLGFLTRIKHHHDPYLETRDEAGRICLCGAFMHAVRRGDFGRGKNVKQVQGNTAITTLDNVAAAFVESGRRSPIIDTRGKTHTHIDRQTRGYKKDDPTTKHEKALPPRVFRHIMAIAVLPQERARAVLVSGALFFAMRS